MKWKIKKKEYDKSRIFLDYDGDKFVWFENEDDLFRIYTSYLFEELNPSRKERIRYKGSVLTEEDATLHSEFYHCSWKNVEKWKTSLPDLPRHKKLRRKINLKKDFTYLFYKRVSYIKRHDSPVLVEIRKEGFQRISDQMISGEIVEFGRKISQQEAFEKSLYDSMPDYVAKWLFEPVLYSKMRPYGEIISWPADLFPALKSYFEINGKTDMTLYYSTYEDKWETMFGDGIYYSFDRAFLSEKAIRCYTEFRSVSSEAEYHFNSIDIRYERDFFFSDVHQGDGYDSDTILRHLNSCCSDPQYNEHVTELLKIYCILHRRLKCEKQLEFINYNVKELQKKPSLMESGSLMQQKLVYLCQNYAPQMSRTKGISYFFHGPFDHSRRYTEFEEFHYVENLDEILAVLEAFFASLESIDYNVVEEKTDDFHNPSFERLVEKIHNSIDDIRKNRNDLNQMLNGHFKSFLQGVI